MKDETIEEYIKCEFARPSGYQNPGVFQSRITCKDFKDLESLCGVAIGGTDNPELPDIRIDSVTNLPPEFEYKLTEDGGAIVTRKKTKTIPTLSSGK